MVIGILWRKVKVFLYFETWHILGGLKFRKDSLEVEFLSAHLLPSAQWCRILPLQFWRWQLYPRVNTVLWLRRKRLFFHEQHYIMLDLNPSRSHMLKGQQNTGRLPLAADRRPLHGCPSTAWMPSTFTETESVICYGQRYWHHSQRYDASKSLTDDFFVQNAMETLVSNDV